MSLLNVQVMYMKGSKSWKGIEIAKEIKEKLLAKGLKVVNILSDEGSNLKNAAGQLKLPHLPDIGHALATCLKQTFEKQEAYILFTKLVASYLSKGVNQDLSYLCPPKLGKKARFMNQSRVVNWAEIMLTNWGKLDETEKARMCVAATGIAVSTGTSTVTLLPALAGLCPIKVTFVKPLPQ